MKKQVLFSVRFRIQGKKKQKIDFMSANNKSISAKKWHVKKYFFSKMY